MAERDPKVRGPEAPSIKEDYAAWLQAQLCLLRERRFEELDLTNLLDEVSDLGTSDYKAFVSAIEIVVAHMLKWDVQPERRSNSWIASIEEHRARIEQDLEDSPSYKSRFEDAISRAYKPARALASKETDLPLKLFPATCPYSRADIQAREHSLG
jgi:hypothetical protein